ncbi:MAG: histidinol dehydrogenase [Sedimentisphaerales bacterium]
MANDIDKILIKYDQPCFYEKLKGLRETVCTVAIFNPRSEEGQKVAAIIEDVWEREDEAVSEYTEKFDRLKLTPEQFRITDKELKNAHKTINKKVLKSIRQAIRNVRQYQLRTFASKDKSFKSTGIKYTAIKRVGICVPGASAPLPSTVIMTAVPAQVAGVKEIVIVSPPRYKGSIHPVILATCYELKIKEVYRIGGVQAVAALADGTNTIKAVDMIVGPGNQWVQTAKRYAFGQVGIDSISGPSEVLIIANDKANPIWVAADMLSQAEHVPGSAILLTNSLVFAEKVLGHLKNQTEQLNRREEVINCLTKYSSVAVLENMDEVVEWANKFAIEHLQIQCGKQSRQIAKKIKNAGAIFIGDYSPVAVGDYWAGPSHTLPTGGSARFSSALSANDFVKATSIIEYDKKKLAESADDIIRLAEAEGLDAHAKSIKIRQQK